MGALVLLGSFALLCALGVPVAYALGLAALAGAWWIDIPFEAVTLKISDGTDDFALLAIPFFVLAGAIMAEGGMAGRLINLARVFVGAIRGGLALVNILASSLFGCVSGSSVADTASIGWDAFYEGGIVRYVRVNTVFDEGGRSSVHFAYLDGKPMAAEERRGASVGWDGNGQVMWNQRPGGGTVDEAGLEALRAEALRVQQMAQEKVDAARKK